MSVRQAASPGRLSIEKGVVEASTFAQDLRTGLRAAEKYIHARHIYDEVGSALYEAITHLPEYYLTRTEREILERNAGAMLELTGPVEIVELGPGNGEKTRVLLEAALARQPLVRYRPIDISPSALQALSERLVAEYDRLVVTGHAGDYRTALLQRPLRNDLAMLVLFLGSSIGNYETKDAIALLRGVSAGMLPGDALLLGTDLKKARAELELAYDDPGGVTAAFNRNVLVRINRELGGEFDLRAFRFVVSYDEERACVHSYQESLVDQRVRIAALDMEVTLRAGERILTESSYKYDAEAIRALAREAGLSVSAAWSDDKHRFTVSLLRRAR